MWIRDAVKGTSCCMEVWVQPCWMVFISKNPLPHGSFQSVFHPPNRENLILVNPFHSKSLKKSAETVFTNYFYLNSNFRVNNQINVKKPSEKKNPHAPKYESVPFSQLQGRKGNPHLSPSSSSLHADTLLCPSQIPWMSRAGLCSAPAATQPQQWGTDIS